MLDTIQWLFPENKFDLSSFDMILVGSFLYLQIHNISLCMFTVTSLFFLQHNLLNLSTVYPHLSRLLGTDRISPAIGENRKKV